MRRILILGPTGMLGRAVVRHFRSDIRYEVFTLGRQVSDYHPHRIVDVTDFPGLEKAIAEVGPDFIVNCVGLVKSVCAHIAVEDVIRVNSILPLVVSRAAWAFSHHTRVVHVSTDCVFSGRQSGGYNENSIPDPIDLYGVTKLAGETKIFDNVLTLRTSIVGMESRGRCHGLLQWFFNSATCSDVGNVGGYRNAFFSGVTTDELARLISEILLKSPSKETRLLHVAGPRISKFELLTMFRDELLRRGYRQFSNFEITPVDEFVIDRSLDDELFRKLYGLNKKSWLTMLREMLGEERL